MLERAPAHNPDADPNAKRTLTKVVATIGPASEDCVGQLIDAGLSVARLNFSHGTDEDHRRRVAKIRAAAQERLMAIGILADLPGPKMRTGTFPEGSIDLEEGDIVRLKAGDGEAGPGEVYVNVSDLADKVEPGHRIFLADGQVEVKCQSVEGEWVVGKVLRPGPVGNKKGVHLPDSDVTYDLPTDEDRRLIQLGNELGVDFYGISFVGNAEEIRTVRSLADGQHMVSKIERLSAVRNLAEIIEESDGIMVARGDLGVELPLSELPLTQKAIIEATVKAGKYTITATEMLESMIHSSRPTRAEVSDVANAVLDGTDAVMLSAETAVGEFPIDAVRTMAEVARSAEGSPRYAKVPALKLNPKDTHFFNATAMASVHVATALDLRRIICFTETGNTVRLLSRFRPRAEIVALCPDQETVNRMSVLSHVRALLFRREPSLEDMIYMAAEMLVVRGIAEYDEQTVIVAGVPPGVAKSTNVMKLHRIGEEVRFH
ncbi:MAG: pyruvate kinase [Planctomycetes bacterium]|nr:pyruvate kinase [Planctomycetota bacterium]